MSYHEPCPCCGKAMVGSFETCPVCGWCNDYASNMNPDVRDMPNNDLSLNEAKAYFRKTGKRIPYEGTYYIVWKRELKQEFTMQVKEYLRRKQRLT